MINVIKSLRMEGKSNFRFPNFLDSSSVLKIIKHESPQGEFAHLSYLSYLFVLRVPSEALAPRRAYSSDELGPMGESFDRCQMPPGEEKLIPKRPHRKNLQVGCILTMSCFCSIASSDAHKASPVHFLWKEVCARVPSGELTPPIYTVRKIIPVLKRVCEKIGLRNSSRYSTHAFRLGASQEMKEKGSKRHTISIIRDWRSLSFGC